MTDSDVQELPRLVVARRLLPLINDLRDLEMVVAAECDAAGWATETGIWFHDRLRYIRDARHALSLERMHLEDGVHDRDQS